MSDSSSEVLEELPPRPPGIEKLMYLIAISMTVLPLIAIALRFYARRLKKTGLSWDDYMILPAMLGTLATAICIFIGTSRGDVGRHTHLIEIDGELIYIYTPATQMFQKIEYATFITTVLTFGFTKFTVLLFYKRIFQGRLFIAACWTMIGLVFIWTVGFSFSTIFQCYPFSVNWSPEGGGNVVGQCIDVNRMLMATAWSDVITNTVIILLPLGCIWELKMPFWKKIGVYSVFLLGALTVGFGIAKLVVYYRVFGGFDNDYDALDLTFTQSPLIYWPMIESGVGIIGACLPLMRPLISGASSRGFMRNLRTFKTTTDNSDTFWEHSDNTALRDEWNSSVSSTKFGSASQASMKPGGSISTTELDPKSRPKKPQGSLSTMRWGTESLPPMDPNHHYADYNPSPRNGSAAVPMQQFPIQKLGVLDDDDLDYYPSAPRNPRKPHDIV